MDAAALRYIPDRANRLWLALAITLQLGAAGLAPLAWNWSGIAFAAVVPVYVYGTLLGWLLIHEAIHQKLLTGRRANDLMGRLLAVLFGCPFHILKIGHMTHHRYNRGSLDTTEMIPADARWPWLWGLAYYARILGLLYVSEVVAPLVFFVWRWARRTISRIARSAAVDGVLNLFSPPIVNAIRVDAVIAILWLAALVWWSWAALPAFAILFAARAAAVSYYDNAYHYGTDPDDAGAAMNLSVPSWWARLILNHHMHRIHHKYPVASWAKLPEFFARDGETFDKPLASVALDQLKGPVRRKGADRAAGDVRLPA